MKLYVSALLLALSSTSFAEGWILGLHVGHQNLKAHSKGSESLTYEISGSNTGPIDSSPYTYKDDESGLAFLNTTVEGLRFGYDMGRLALISDLDFARYFMTTGQLNILALGLSAQFALVQTQSFKFYTSVGFSDRNARLSLYEKSFSIEFEGIAQSRSTEIDAINLVNYDLGLGIALGLTNQMSLSIETKYSDTISKGTLNSRQSVTIRNETDSLQYTSDAKSKNNTFTTQELTVGLLFAL